MGEENATRLLLEGRPGIGKSIIARRLVGLLQQVGVPVAGFTTQELRGHRRREGFTVESVAGERAVLAHVSLPGPHRVGRYGVDLQAFERIALPALRPPGPGGVVVVDEVGRMELGSAAFRDAVTDLLGQDVGLVATVQAARHPFTDALKLRPDVQVVRVTEANRDALPEQLAARLARARSGGDDDLRPTGSSTAQPDPSSSDREVAAEDQGRQKRPQAKPHLPCRRWLLELVPELVNVSRPRSASLR